MPDAAGAEDRYALAIDLGTNGLKVGLVSLAGVVAWTAGTDLRTHLTADGGAEQDPGQWWHLVRDAAWAALRSGTIRPGQVVAVSATGQWASTIPVAGDGTPVGPCVLWTPAAAGTPAASSAAQWPGILPGCWPRGSAGRGAPLRPAAPTPFT